jgi:ketosteroid isomerase-like protein
VKRLAVFHLSLLLSAIPTPAQDKTRIVALENSWNQAELHNDAHAVDLLLADDFVMTVADGYTLNKAAMLASVRDTSYRPDVLQSDNMEVHMYGNTAIVTGSYLEKRQGQGQAIRAAGALHGYMDQSSGTVAMRRQSFQCETLARDVFPGSASWDSVASPYNP